MAKKTTDLKNELLFAAIIVLVLLLFIGFAWLIAVESKWVKWIVGAGLLLVFLDMAIDSGRETPACVEADEDY